MSDCNSSVPEGFRQIPGYPRYSINENGIVLSICPSRGNGKNRAWTDAARLNPMTHNRGYHKVKLCHDGRQRKVYVHTLVLLAFVGPCPDGMECRHLDGNPANNHVSNLAWGTSAENHSDRISHGTSGTGESNGRAKLTASDVIEIRERAANGEAKTSIAKDFAVHYKSILRIVNFRAWNHI